MSGKWLALAAVAAGIALIIYAMNTTGEGANGLDRLPLTILMVLAGGVLVLVGAGYFVVRIFVAL